MKNFQNLFWLILRLINHNVHKRRWVDGYKWWIGKKLGGGSGDLFQGNIPSYAKIKWENHEKIDRKGNKLVDI